MDMEDACFISSLMDALCFFPKILTVLHIGYYNVNSCISVVSFHVNL